MHATPHRLNHHRSYQSHTLPARIATTVAEVEVPPAVPPQPHRFNYEPRNGPSVDAPPPPPRRYQVVSMPNGAGAPPPPAAIETPTPLVSFAKALCDSPQLAIGHSRVASRPIVIKDPRRKPYYYNELDQNSGNDTEPITITDSNANHVNEVVAGKFPGSRDSGASLNHII